jgi:hypothetical protein
MGERASADFGNRELMGKDVFEKRGPGPVGEVGMQLAEVQNERLGADHQRFNLQPVRRTSDRSAVTVAESA